MKKSDHAFLGNRFETWWLELNPSEPGETRPRTARADLAQLRRVGLIDTRTGSVPDVAMALTIAPFRDLHRRLSKTAAMGEDFEERLVVAAVVLAHVRKNHAGGSMGALLGAGENADQPLLAEARFLRLMRVRTMQDLFDQARRLAVLLKGEAPVGDLGVSLLRWLVEPEVRRTWARDYYGLNQQNLLATQTPTDTGAD